MQLKLIFPGKFKGGQIGERPFASERRSAREEAPAERKGPVFERDLSDSRKGAGLAGTQSRGEPAEGEEGKAAQCERSPIVSTDKLSLSLLVVG